MFKVRIEDLVANKLHDSFYFDNLLFLESHFCQLVSLNFEDLIRSRTVSAPDRGFQAGVTV